MDKELIEKVLIQLQPDLAKEFAYAILEDNKKLKALEIIKPYIDVYAPNRSVDRDVYMLCVGHDSYEISKEKYDLLKEVFEDKYA